ncbi:hypothetical protein BKA62DRAFT_739457 [Auriculariales sp. MPI-PUGE-AT-0066]|nr:hypothetical protein BKA62DRAFT_739457 [Auriculariales sp. MPI-PUGE-AT-0066]
MYWSLFLLGTVGTVKFPKFHDCQLDWKSSDIKAAVSILAQAVSNAEDKPNFWSEKLNQSLRGLLRCLRQSNDWFYGFDDNIRTILSSLRQPAHGGVLLKLETHSAPGSFIKDTMVNILSKSRSNDGLSTWDLIHDNHRSTTRYLAKALVVELAIISHVSLAALPAPDDNLAELLDILAGGDRGIQLALANPKDFVITASHGRVVSPQWWDNIKEQLSNLTNERWSKRRYKRQHATPQALVAEIEAVGPCKECATTISKARQLLDARAAVDSTPAMPQSGDADSIRSHGHGSDGAVAGAASPNGWRRRTGHLLEYFGISGPQRSTDDEMQLGARIETVEED